MSFPRCLPAGDNTYIFQRENGEELIRLRFPHHFTKEQKIEAAGELVKLAIALMDAK